jgi:hypothetical protein
VVNRLSLGLLPLRLAMAGSAGPVDAMDEPKPGWPMTSVIKHSEGCSPNAARCASYGHRLVISDDSTILVAMP